MVMSVFRAGLRFSTLGLVWLEDLGLGFVLELFNLGTGSVLFETLEARTGLGSLSLTRLVQFENFEFGSPEES